MADASVNIRVALTRQRERSGNLFAGDVCVGETRQIRAHAPCEFSAAISCDRHAALDLTSGAFRMS